MNEGERPTNPAVQTVFQGCGLLFFFFTALSWVFC